MSSTEPVHQESEDHRWTVQVPDHPARQDSPEFVAARTKMNELASQAGGLIYGPGPYQDHHGGSLWLKDDQGWFMVRNLAGIEWSAQFCVSSDTRVLTADLRWIPIGEVRAGDHLAGFDESVPDSGRRRWRRSIVERHEVVSRPCYDLTFADGTKVRASADHLWLAGEPGPHATASWCRTDALVSGQDGSPAVLRAVQPWAEDRSWEAGYLAAAFDGEGSLAHPAGEAEPGCGDGQQLLLVFSQRDNEMYPEVVRCLKQLGYIFREDIRGDVRQVVISRADEVLRFLGSIRPRRMLAQFQCELLRQFSAVGRARIAEAAYVGEQPVVAVTTSTRTYVAEGLASHNCADPAKVDLLRQNAKRLYDLLAPGVKQELDPDGLLEKPIQDAAGVAQWTDSIFNAAVPLHPGFHTGVLPAGGQTSPPAAADPQPGGVHHYPTPIADIQLFKYEDFQLWVTDEEGHPAAVAPVAERGSGNASVHVLYATPGTRLAQQKQAAEHASTPLILGPEHPLSKQAYQSQ